MNAEQDMFDHGLKLLDEETVRHPTVMFLHALTSSDAAHRILQAGMLMRGMIGFGLVSLQALLTALGF
jgi:hypothetical protein